MDSYLTAHGGTKESVIYAFHVRCGGISNSNSNWTEWSTILIPNHIFLVRFGGISGKFGQAMVCLLARCS